MKVNSVKRILDIVKFERKEISAIYFYAILNGLVQLSLPLGIQSIIGFVLGGSFSTSLVLLIFFVVTGVFITGWLQVNQMKVIEKIQQQLFVRYSFSYAFLIPRINLKSIDSYYLPELVNRFFDTISLQKSMSKLLLDIPVATIQILFGLILLSFYHPVFIFFGIVLIAVLFMILRFSGTKGLETSIEESNYKYNVAGWLEEIGRVVSSLKFSRGSFFHLYRTDEQVTGYLNARTRHFKILLFQYWSLVAFKVIITASMLIVGSVLLVNQQLNIGQFIAAEIVILAIMTSVEKLIGNLDKVYDVLTSVEKLAKLTELPEENPGGVIPTGNSGTGMNIKVEKLSFSYDDEIKSLNQIDLSIKAGEKICLRGSFGSGKSTLLKVLTGSFQPYEGIILINNIPLHNIGLKELRSRTGVLLGEQDIFKGTLWENITLGNDDIPLERGIELAGVLGLQQFIASNPDGWQMALHPLGKRLPRKIIQKILLIRALIHKPDLLLLEEPFLALDSETAEKVKELLLHKLPGVTLIVSTTNDEFASQCDQQIVLENGSIKQIIKK